MEKVYNVRVVYQPYRQMGDKSHLVYSTTDFLEARKIAREWQAFDSIQEVFIAEVR